MDKTCTKKRQQLLVSGIIKLPFLLISPSLFNGTKCKVNKEKKASKKMQESPFLEFRDIMCGLSSFNVAAPPSNLGLSGY